MNERTTSEHWTAETSDGRTINPGDRFQWRDLSGWHNPRRVTVHHLDPDEGLVIVTDDTQTHYMAIPEELH